MSAFQKAIALLELQRSATGRWPDEVRLVKYRDAVAFARHHPGDAFAEHQKERASLVTWCEARGIVVVDTRPRGRSARDRAEAAAQPPYRLGVDIHGSSGGPNMSGQRAVGALGWFMVRLAPSDRDHDGGEI